MWFDAQKSFFPLYTTEAVIKKATKQPFGIMILMTISNIQGT